MRPQLRKNYHGTDYPDRSHAHKKEQLHQKDENNDLIPHSTVKVKTIAYHPNENAPINHFPTPSPSPLQNSTNPRDEVKILFKASCSLLKDSVMTAGTIKITNAEIYFIASKKQPTVTPSVSFHNLQRSYVWSVKDLVSAHRRSYLFTRRGIELFFSNRKNYLILLEDEKAVDVINSVFASTGLSADFIFNATPDRIFASRLGTMMTKKWRKRQISNFEYLMWINTVSGRTYNDYNQYPIFPWVISDYTSSQIDLDDPNIYRDLSKPIGALNAKRLQSFRERQQQMFDDDSIPRFLYGSHYSSIGIILYYLIRLEPFTAHFLSFQGGHFDIPERMFTSIPKTWDAVMNDKSDVKELVSTGFAKAFNI